jgi:hypothetical protein
MSVRARASLSSFRRSVILATAFVTLVTVGGQAHASQATKSVPTRLAPIAADRQIVNPATGPDVPAQGSPGPIVKSLANASAAGDVKEPKKSARSVRLPSTGTVHYPAATSSTAKAYWNGSRYVAPAGAARPGRVLHRLAIPRNPGKISTDAQPHGPQAIYGSTQVDAAVGTCTQPFANETSVAQSSANPNLVIVAAQAYANSTGCADSHPWVYYSHDGGQHWAQQVMPGLTHTAGGDPVIAYDRKHGKFVYGFLEFNRDGSGNPINAFIGAETTLDGSSLGQHVNLDSDAGCGCSVDKPMITADNNPSSPHYGRVLMVWTEFTASGAFYITAYTDDGGANWSYAPTSVNYSYSVCGNGASAAFDANGEAMVAWYDCDGGYSLREELSADGGANWNAPADTTILGISPIDAGGCQLNTATSGTHFRCNSFPTLAGDPASDSGGQAFFVAWANEDSISGSNVAEIHGIATVNGGATWDHHRYVSFANLGDKFFPWASFSPDGRLSIGYSDREYTADDSHPQGTGYAETMTDASSLAFYRGVVSTGEYIAYGVDTTATSPGGLTFIGDYAGNASNDTFDTFPVWTDVRGGSANARTADVCFVDCYTFLSPYGPVFQSRTTGTTFEDLYQFNTDTGFGGSGHNYWNAVGIREGNDGTTIDDDMTLWNTRYFSGFLSSGNYSPPFNDYVLENDNGGHAPSKPYFIDVHSYTTLGGSYRIEWAAGNTVLGAAVGGSMGASSVIRVYDTFDATATLYYVGLRPAGGNTSNYRVAAHTIVGGDYQSSTGSAGQSGNVAAGQPAFLSYSTAGSPSGYDAVVVQNNNGGSGAYTLYRDTVAPTGSVSIDGGAPFTASTSATLSLSASNATAGDPVLDMRFSTDGVTYGPFVPYSTSATITLPGGDGTKTVYVKFRNGAGAVSAAATDTIVLDQTAPSITKVPGPTFLKQQLGATKVPIKISWAGTDALSGVDHYELFESVDGGAFGLVKSPNAAHATRKLAPGHTYRYEVRAIDNAGNVGAFGVGSTFTLSAYQESSGSIAYSSGWSTSAFAGAYGGSVKFASLAGKTADFSFNGSQVAWVTTVNTDRGSANLSVDAGPTTAVSTNGAVFTPALVRYVKKVASGPHVLHLTVLGTVGNPRVDVDAFLVIS